MNQPDSIAAVGRAVRRYRQRLGLSQSQLADKSGLDRKTVNRIEQGHHSMRVSTLFELADVLGVDPQDLVSGEAASPPGSMIGDEKT